MGTRARMGISPSNTGPISPKAKFSFLINNLCKIRQTKILKPKIIRNKSFSLGNFLYLSSWIFLKRRILFFLKIYKTYLLYHHDYCVPKIPCNFLQAFLIYNMLKIFIFSHTTSSWYNFTRKNFYVQKEKPESFLSGFIFKAQVNNTNYLISSVITSFS